MSYVEAHDLQQREDPCRVSEAAAKSLGPLSRADTWTVYAVLEAVQFHNHFNYPRAQSNSVYTPKYIQAAALTAASKAPTAKSAIDTRSIPPTQLPRAPRSSGPI